MVKVKNYPLRLEQETYDKLLERATKAGHSVNVEIIDILESVVGLSQSNKIRMEKFYMTEEGKIEGLNRR